MEGARSFMATTLAQITIKFEATPWDINCGQCEEWAEAAAKELGFGSVQWLPEFPFRTARKNKRGIRHCVLMIGGRYYDAQNIFGVTDWRSLDVVRRVPRSRYLRHIKPRREAIFRKLGDFVLVPLKK